MSYSTTIAGVKFANPIIPASGTAAFGKELEQIIDISRFGGICTKGLTLEERQGNDSPRVAESPSGMLNAVGLQNPGVDSFIGQELPRMRGYGIPIIANIAGKTEDDYVQIAERLSATDVEMLEMNISCPNVKAGGVAFGVYPADIERITARVRRVTTKPLMVKLSPNVADIAANARAAENGGADAISLINTLSAMAVDWRRRRPILANNIGGLSGAAIKPVALRMVSQVYRAVKLPIVGMGGIMSAEDVAEFLVCGASAVQVGTLLISDPKSAESLSDCLTTLLKSSKIPALSEIVGSLVFN